MAYESFITNKNTTKVVTEEDVAYDDCYNGNCKYLNKTENKCVFETCLFKELPKHRLPVSTECMICKTDYECNIEDHRLPICPNCLLAIRHLVIAHRNTCTECEPIKLESEVDQYLAEGDDGSNEDWNH